MGAEATVNVVLEGEGFRWELGLLWFEHPGAAGIDGEWIDATVELVSSEAGEWRARRETDVLTMELVDFYDSLLALLSTKTGEATLETLEDETGVTIAPDPARTDKYLAEVFVRCHTSAELRVREMTVTESDLRSTAFGLRQAMAQFPVQGRPESNA